MPPAYSKSNAFYYLAIALAVSVVLAFPAESAQHNFVFGGAPCVDTIALLNRGLIVQAILTPLFVFLLPGAGSILAAGRKRFASVRLPNAGASRGQVTITVVAFVLLIVCPLMLLRAVFFLRYIHPSTLVKTIVIFEMILEAAAGALGIVAAIYLLREHMTRPPVGYFAAGWLFAAAVPVVWWYGLKSYATQNGLCQMLFDRSRIIAPYTIDDLNDSFHYFVWLSVFATIWVGTTAAGLRLLSAQEEENSSAGSELRAFRGFFWVYLLGWAVQYRVSLWSAQPAPQDNVDQEWLTRAVVTFIYLTASSLWTLAFIRWFWKWRVRAWWVSVGVAFAGTYVIDILTMLAFFWLVLLAPAALLPLSHWNVWGGLWALTVGTWRWQALRHVTRVAGPSGQALGQQPLVAALPGPLPQPLPGAAGAPSQAGPLEPPPALAGLKAFQIVAVAVGIFLFVALLYAAAFSYIVLHQHRPPYYH